jgi:hypothetical protein
LLHDVLKFLGRCVVLQSLCWQLFKDHIDHI